MTVSYIEHLNYLIIGLASDPRRTARVIRLGRETMGINDRVKTVFEGLGI